MPRSARTAAGASDAADLESSRHPRDEATPLIAGVVRGADFGHASAAAAANSRRDSRGHPTIDHRERIWDRRSEIAPDPFQILYQKKYAFCGSYLNLEFGLIQPCAD